MRQHYLYVGSRRVHYRRAGSGPPLVLLPAVPQSSKMVEPLILAASARHTVIALDAPGYGESAALPVDSPHTEDYAAALAETLDALHLPRVDLYGVDTSAAVAAEFACRRPGRVNRLFIERPPLPTAAERDDLLAHYWPPLVPDDEGSHLVKAWGRLRDSYTFRPWYRRAMDTRLRRNLPTALALHHEIVDLFRAGLAYWQGPHAALRYELSAVLKDLRIPVIVLDTASGRDRLAASLGGSVPPNLAFADLANPDADDALSEVAARILATPAADTLPDAPPPLKVQPVPGEVRRDYADSRAGQLLVRLVGSGRPDGGGRPLVLTFGSLFSGAGTEESTLAWAADRPVIGFDLPGVGDSAAVPGEPDMEEVAAAVLEGIDSLGLTEYDLYGSHSSASNAIEVAIARPQQVKHLILDGTVMFTEEELAHKLPAYFQPLRITDDGAYLVWSWYFVRDMYLWYPWHDHRGDHFRPDWMLLDTARHHARLVDFLKGGLHFVSPYRAAITLNSRKRLPLITVPTLLTSSPDDTLRPGLAEAATLVPHAPALETPGRRTPEARAITMAIFRQFFADKPLGAGIPVSP